LIIAVIIIIILLQAGLAALNFFILAPQKAEILAQKNSGIINIKERPIKRLDTEIFKNEKFSRLVMPPAVNPGQETTATGKRNIFLASD